jgi:hypothetical protein
MLVMCKLIWRFLSSAVFNFLNRSFFAPAGKADLHSRRKSPMAIGHHAFAPPRALKNQIPLRFFKNRHMSLPISCLTLKK